MWILILEIIQWTKGITGSLEPRSLEKTFCGADTKFSQVGMLPAERWGPLYWDPWEQSIMGLVLPPLREHVTAGYGENIKKKMGSWTRMHLPKQQVFAEFMQAGPDNTKIDKKPLPLSSRFPEHCSRWTLTHSLHIHMGNAVGWSLKPNITKQNLEGLFGAWQIAVLTGLFWRLSGKESA